MFETSQNAFHELQQVEISCDTFLNCHLNVLKVSKILLKQCGSYRTINLKNRVTDKFAGAPCTKRRSTESIESVLYHRNSTIQSLSAQLVLKISSFQQGIR